MTAVFDWHTSDMAELLGSILPKDDPTIEAVCAGGSGAFCCSRNNTSACRTDRPKA